MNDMKPEAGQVVECRYPFQRVVRQEIVCASMGTGEPDDEAEYEDVVSWAPGHVEWMMTQHGREYVLADGAGKLILTVVSTHKPGRFPSRVFFTREWEDPEGKRFGRRKLLIATAEKFRRTARGYQHDWEVADRGVDVVLAAARKERAS